MSFKLFVCLLSCISFSGCASYGPIPMEYQGRVVTVWDNVNKIFSTNAHFFELIAVDGRRIATSSYTTRDRSFKIGFSMAATPLSREIPESSQALLIGGFNYLVADLFGLGDSIYRVKGSITVDLERGKTYIVNGELGEDYSLVWLEDEKTGIIVSDIISDGDVGLEYLSELRSEKIAVHKQNQIDRDLKEEKERRLLNRAIDYVDSQGCDGGNELEASLTDVYLMAEALFKNEMYQESRRCFERISEFSTVPKGLYQYLFLIYDVGLGVQENRELAIYWLERYESSKK